MAGFYVSSPSLSHPPPLIATGLCWVSSLAYLNFLGTKGFVVVVVTVSDTEKKRLEKNTRCKNPETHLIVVEENYIFKAQWRS
jgi:hypothetical protein